MRRALVVAALAWAAPGLAAAWPDGALGVHDFRMVDPLAGQCGGSMRVEVRRAGRGAKVSHALDVSLLDLVGREEGTLVLDPDVAVKRRWVERDGQSWWRVRKGKATLLRVTDAEGVRQERAPSLHPDHDGGVVELLLAVVHAARGDAGGTFWRLSWPTAQAPATWSTLELTVTDPAVGATPLGLDAAKVVTLTREATPSPGGEPVHVYLDVAGRPLAMTAEGRRFVVVRADLATCGS